LVDKSLTAGEAFSDVIAAEIDQAKTVASVTSCWVCAEAVRALQREKLVPARLEDCDIGVRLKRKRAPTPLAL
jgi:hypothetical protein